MLSIRRSTAASALLVGAALLAFAPAVALAHGGDEGAEGMEGMNMGNATQDAPMPTETVYPPTYFAYPEHQAVIYTHIAIMTACWVVVLPVAVMLSIARSRYTLLSQLVFLAGNAVGVLFAVIYNASTPDLYPNNAHHKLGWIATSVVSAHVVLGLLAHVAGAFKSRRKARVGGDHSRNISDVSDASANGMSRSERRGFIPVSTAALAEHHSHHGHLASPYRMSNDSGQGTEPNTESLRSNSVSTSDGCNDRPKESFDLPANDHHYDDDDDDDEDLRARMPASLQRRGSGRFYTVARSLADKISSRAWKSLLFVYNFVDRTILILGFITYCCGIIAFGRLFEGHGIFNGLAHWIKGGVFFWYGILTLGRWAGCFGEWGWAWNVRPKTASQKWIPTAEFVESFLIFFYGATNVFLEHLGNTGNGYTMQDLEHISITILFLGGGLCGMLIESTRIRELLNTTVTEAALDYPEHNYHEEERDALRPPPQYKFSVNPIPALVILLLGIMMGSHTQHTMISSMVHKQWGNLLSGASFARGFSYVIVYLRPPQSILPSRPPTELLTAFGLIAGGIIFMASSGDTVNGMIHYNLDAMFMYTVTMGCVGLLMAWEILVIAIKGWAVRKESGRPTGAYQLA